MANEKAQAFGATLPSLIGLATKIGTSIPNLRKVKKQDTTQRAVRQGAVKMANTAVGASQTGFGASRGLALRSGLRAASATAREALDPISTAAAQDEALYQNQKIQRNERLAEFGSDLAASGAAIGQEVVETSMAKRAAEEEEADAVREEAGYPGQGYPGQDPQELQAAFEQAKADQAQRELAKQEDIVQAPSPMDGYAPDPMETDLQLEGPLGIYRRSLGLPSRPVMRLAPELEYKLRVENLAFQEMERQGLNPMAFAGRLNRLMKKSVNPRNPANYPSLEDGGE